MNNTYGAAEVEEGVQGGFVKNAQRDVRMGFVKKVYGILTAQLLVTVGIAAPICGAVAKQGSAWLQANMWMYMLSVASLVVCMLVMMCCSSVIRPYPQNYIFLGILTLCESVLVGFVSAQYTWQSVLLAAGITVGIFMAMTVYAATSDTDFTGFGPYLAAALFCLIGFGFTIFILGMFGVPVKGLMMLYDFAGVLLFTFYIVYDTQLILGQSITGQEHGHKFGVDEYCFASLNLYLDIINLFLHLLRLFGQRR